MSHGKVTRSVLELCPVSIDLYNYLNINNECEDIDCNNGYRVDILRWRGRHDLFDEDNDGHLLVSLSKISCKILPRCFKIWQVGKKSVPNPCQLFKLARIFLILQDSCSKSMRKFCIA